MSDTDIDILDILDRLGGAMRALSAVDDLADSRLTNARTGDPYRRVTDGWKSGKLSAASDSARDAITKVIVLLSVQYDVHQSLSDHALNINHDGTEKAN